jgi:glucosamine-6-phosphate deaminase
MDIMTIPREGLGKGTSIRINIVGSAADLAWHFALIMAGAIKANNRIGKRTTMIVPVGPTGEFRRLATLCNIEGIQCSNLVLFNMDEYCFEDGSVVPVEHPMSFRAFMEREFHARLDPDKRMKDENKIFPDPQTPHMVAEKIAQVGGIDICFGGIGINGHVAFNEPPEPGERVDDFDKLATRVVRLSRETRVVNSIFAGGDLDSIPPKAVTLGMKEILGSRAIHIYLDWPWQSAVVRKTVHGPVTERFPASFLQTHPNVSMTITEEVAELPQNLPK